MSSSNAPVQPAGPRRRLNILVADDEPHIVSSVQRFFTMRGHTVHTAPDADSAISLLGSHRFDAALVDARMPGGGLSVIEHLEEDPGFRGPVVLMTGALAADPHIKVGPGVVRLQKPFRLAQLVTMVEGDATH